MTILSARITALAAIVALGSLVSTTAHAAIVRSTDGAPVLTRDGNCVISGWEGSEDCEAAKAAAGEAPKTGEAWSKDEDHERVVYFDFNKSALTAQAKHRLDHLAKKIHMMNKRDHHTTEITIVGYADRLGSADYDKKLALKRAETVRTYLVGKGVKAKKTEVRSLGKADPKTSCPDKLPRAKLIDCLKGDRRVEIEISGHE